MWSHEPGSQKVQLRLNKRKRRDEKKVDRYEKQIFLHFNFFKAAALIFFPARTRRRKKNSDAFLKG